MATNSAIKNGTLYIVATPIGNIDDITLRAINTLKSVDYILAEDTRHSTKLLNSVGIKNKLSSFHAHNENEKYARVIDDLQSGLDIALISDAGTPLISDPGYPLVQKAQLEKITVVPIPGACAIIAALSAAGVSTDTFTFAGFLPAKSCARISKIQELKKLETTIVVYESTHRIIDSINDIAKVLGSEAKIVLAKELTKAFETLINASCIDIITWLMADSNRCKGEFVIIIPAVKTDSQLLVRELLTELLADLPVKKAVKIASKISGANKNLVYDLALQLK